MMTLQYFFNGFFHFRTGTKEELQEWINVLNEDGNSVYTLYDEDMNVVYSIKDFINYLNNNAFELRHDMTIIEEYAEKFLKGEAK